MCLRWAVQRGYTIVPKSSQESRLKENLNLFDFELADDEMKAISSLNCNRRFNSASPLILGRGEARQCFIWRILFHVANTHLPRRLARS